MQEHDEGLWTQVTQPPRLGGFSRTSVERMMSVLAEYFKKKIPGLCQDQLEMLLGKSYGFLTVPELKQIFNRRTGEVRRRRTGADVTVNCAQRSARCISKSASRVSGKCTI